MENASTSGNVNAPESAMKKKKVTIGDALSEVTQFLKKIDGNESKEDIDDQYGRYVASYLKSISDAKKKEMARMEIQRVLFKIKFDM